MVWKEAWLRRADPDERGAPSPPLGRLDALVQAGTRRPEPSPTGEPLYVCQATQMPEATTLLPVWKPGQYVEDYRSGNTSLMVIVGRLLRLLYLELAEAGVGLGSPCRWLYNVVQRIRGGTPFPERSGNLPLGGPTPTVNLGLQVGEVVRVRSSAEIMDTVDKALFNRGMGFHPEMTLYCGQTFRVGKRVNKIINEKTGQLKVLKNSCLVLDGVECHGCFSRPLNCPRASPAYWREIWLERVDSPNEAAKPAPVK